jgi:dUTP pyrophosphatase
MVEVRVRLLDAKARLPVRANPGDGGADLFSVESVVVPPGERRDVGTGLAVEIPAGFAGFVQPRSGLAFKHGIMLVNSPGLIDAGYRGEVRICLHNLGTEPFVVQPGERIAQLVVQRIEEPDFIAVAEGLSQSTRGGSGFGSTGK